MKLLNFRSIHDVNDIKYDVACSKMDSTVMHSWDDLRHKLCREMRTEIRNAYFIYNLTIDSVLGLYCSRLAWVPISFLDPYANYPKFTVPLIYREITNTEMKDILTKHIVESNPNCGIDEAINRLNRDIKSEFIHIVKGEVLDKYKKFYLAKMRTNRYPESLPVTSVPQWANWSGLYSEYMHVRRLYNEFCSRFESLEFLGSIMERHDIPAVSQLSIPATTFKLSWIHFTDITDFNSNLPMLYTGKLVIQKFKRIMDTKDKLKDTKNWKICNKAYYSATDHENGIRLIKRVKHSEQSEYAFYKYHDKNVIKMTVKEIYKTSPLNYRYNAFPIFDYARKGIYPVSGYFYHTIKEILSNFSYYNTNEIDSGANSTNELRDNIQTIEENKSESSNNNEQKEDINKEQTYLLSRTKRDPLLERVLLTPIKEGESTEDIIDNTGKNDTSDEAESCSNLTE